MDNFSNWLTVMVAAEAAVLLCIVAFMVFRWNTKKYVLRRTNLLKAVQAEENHLQSLNVETEILLNAITMKVDKSTYPDPSRFQWLQCEIYRSRAELARLREWLNEATPEEAVIVAANVKLPRQKNSRLSNELLDLMEDIFGRPENLEDQHSEPLKLLAAS